ncbi:C2 calcium-dependent domain-containing protein 4A [Lepus europaeus]|uniref:C2 calcium-dependent domain-containing protein 4A n=1 Tax=Lepus europaeus TaxID=9983 RepID=UPI002B4690F1|nr:C2 calcium-dependent domain-containing protein 4A [Lepus europaeus]
MWCLERLRWSPERLLRSGDGFFPGRARLARPRTPIACMNVLTPDRIPEFCIPPRLEPSLALAALRNSWSEEAGTDESAGRTDWDPRSQAALSLPHLPRARTAYGFCALLESPHTRRKESLFLGSRGAAALRPRAHTYGGGGRGGGGGDGALVAPRCPRALSAALATSPAAPGGHRPPQEALAPRLRGRCLLRAPHGLLSRALRARGSPGLDRARSVSSGDEDEERGAHPGAPAPAPVSPSPPPGPRPERLEAEGTVALGRAGCALRLAAEYCPGSGRLRVRLLRAEGPAGGGPEPRAVCCRVSLVLQAPGSARKARRAVLGRSRKGALDQDFCFDGLTEEQVRRLAVRVKAENKGRGLERGRRLGQGELPLGSLLLL